MFVAEHMFCTAVGCIGEHVLCHDALSQCAPSWLRPSPNNNFTFRDVNGDPIPANPWRIPLLGYGYGTKNVLMGMDMGQNLPTRQHGKATSRLAKNKP